jgi:prepilin-type N-terminal cleavage/methylation domain-containing protein
VVLRRQEVAMLLGGRRRERSGFTLIELVTVMAVLGILALAVVGPTLDSIDTIRSQAAAARLVTDIRYTQRMALASGLRAWVVVNIPANKYRLYAEDPANPGKDGRVPVLHPSDGTTTATRLGVGAFANISIVTANFNGATELEFDSLGVPRDINGAALGGPGSVTLSSGVVIQVQAVTGFVERL